MLDKTMVLRGGAPVNRRDVAPLDREEATMALVFVDLALGKYNRPCLRVAAPDRPGFTSAILRRVPGDTVSRQGAYPYDKWCIPLRFADIVVRAVYDFYDGAEVTYSAEALEYLEAHCAELRRVCHGADCACGCRPRVGESMEELYPPY